MRPEFKFVVGTYSATYLSKNYTDTTCKLYGLSPESSAVWKFWLVFAVNGGLSVFWKDPGLAKLFQPNTNNPKPTPRATFLSWVLRDTIHIIGAAVLPDYLEELSVYLRVSFEVTLCLVIFFFFNFCCYKNDIICNQTIINITQRD